MFQEKGIFFLYFSKPKFVFCRLNVELRNKQFRHDDYDDTDDKTIASIEREEDEKALHKKHSQKFHCDRKKKKKKKKKKSYI